MSIVDLTSMAEPQRDAQKRIGAVLCGLSEDIPDFCFQCGKCTSGCEAFILLELEPHKIMALSARSAAPRAWHRSRCSMRSRTWPWPRASR
jgi:heterodisulfide reductase subunit C